MSGDRFPYIMGVVGIVDALIGMAWWMFKAALWIIFFAVMYAVIVG